MRIEHDFEYNADWQEIADEFCANDSEYQAKVFNAIGLQFSIWSRDTFAHIQILEIAEQLDEEGKWFIQTLCDYMDNKAEQGLSYADQDTLMPAT